MMKRNYFGKLVAIAMVFAGFSLSSCDKNDNAIIDGEIFEPSTVKKVDGGAVVTASTPAEVSRMITRLRKEIVEAAKNNETYTITINAAALNATATDNIISLLTVNNSDLVVNFTGAITTDEPLVLQSKGVDENAIPSNPAMSKVAINLPGGTSDIDLQVNMPTASVTLKPTSGSLGINELSAKTAWTTLNIENGVTVNWLQNVGGYVVVKNGGKVNGLASTSLDVYPNGIKAWNIVKDSVRTTTPPTDDDYYMVQNGKLLAQENGDYSRFSIVGTEAKASAEPIEIIIPDGVKAWTWENWNGEDYNKLNWPSVNVTGEGDATFMYEGVENDGKVELWDNGINLNRINKLTNVTVDFTHALVQNTETNKYEVLEVDTASSNYKSSNISLPINSENCTFNAKRISMGGYNFNDDILSSTHKNSTFNSLKSDQNYTFEAIFPAQNDKRKSFTLAFDTCEFDQVKFNSDFNGSDDDFKDYKAYISFDSSKIGGKAITTKSSDMINAVYNRHKQDPETGNWSPVTETFYTIDGVNYKPAQVEGKWMLIALDE